MNNTVLEAPSEQLSAEELNRAKAHLEESRDGLLAAVAGLNETQWRFKPTPECWSIAEVVEHLAIVGSLFERRMADFQNGPVPNDSLPDIDDVLANVVRREPKYPTLPPAVPTGKVPTNEVLERALAGYAKTVEMLERTPNLHGHTMVHPVLGALDGYQWMLLVGAHWKRHTLQIRELKALPEFPFN